MHPSPIRYYKAFFDSLPICHYLKIPSPQSSEISLSHSA
nr:MAG TPA: hypothetical protein [Caudoviricetes sp.]